MNITAITPHTSFGSCKIAQTHVFAYDDDCSKAIRQQIRNGIEEHIPFLRDEEELYEQYVAEARNILLRKTAGCFYKVPKYTMFEPGCIRGGGFDHNLLEYLSSKRHIKRVIALAPESLPVSEEEVKKLAKKAKIEYFPSKIIANGSTMLTNETPFANEDEIIESILSRVPAEEKNTEKFKIAKKNFSEHLHAESRKYIEEELIPFIKTMQKGDLFIGCQYGTTRTDTAICLNSWFNPKAENKYIMPDNYSNLIAFNNLYKKLTDEDKLQLGFTKQDEEKFKSAILTRLNGA